ncbi:hypothetical protein EDD17DRAFT_1590606 [Pisolithus thermaeus]|nr:hypothetical protein EDD17DRAFT_1590606 [Pisolithus thermaeus]
MTAHCNGVIHWELAIFLSGKSDANLSRRHDRIGTWQFSSAALLMKPRQTHGLEDVIESFVHVLGWTVEGGADLLARRRRDRHLGYTFALHNIRQRVAYLSDQHVIESNKFVGPCEL